MIKTLLYGVVRAGKLTFNSPAELSTHLQKLDGDVEISVEKKRKKRSLNENSYYHGVVVKMVAEFCGYDDCEEAHIALKMKFLMKRVDGKLDTVFSTRNLTTTEFEDYLSRIRMYFSVEHGLNIPEPNESLEWT